MELSKLNLDDDLVEALSCEDAARWKLHRADGLEVWVTVSPAADPRESFQARLLWTKYPDNPPSLKFRDPATGTLDLPTAWPVVRGFRPGSCDACVNWCSEGFDLHPEWRNDVRYQWKSDGNVLLKVIRTLQDEMDEHFQGRFKS